MTQPSHRETEAYIGLGSNLGDREQLLLEAIRRLDEHPQIRVAACSGLYETDPVGYLDQPPFLNMVVRVATTLSPHELLSDMLEIERSLGRKREIRWGPRTLDLDLLLYGNESIASEELTVPHPRMAERAFVIIPLLEAIDDEALPLSETLKARLENMEGKEGVKLWKIMHWPIA